MLWSSDIWEQHWWIKIYICAETKNELTEYLIRLGPEYFVFRLLSKYIRIKIYRNISLNIVLYVLSDHKSQLLQLHNHIAPIQQFTSCYVRNINSFTVGGLQSELNTQNLEGIFEGFDTNVTVRDFFNRH